MSDFTIEKFEAHLHDNTFLFVHFQICLEYTSRTTTSLVTFLMAVILMWVRGRKDVDACVRLCYIDACVFIEKFSLTAH